MDPPEKLQVDRQEEELRGYDVIRRNPFDVFSWAVLTRLMLSSTEETSERRTTIEGVPLVRCFEPNVEFDSKSGSKRVGSWEKRCP